MSKILKCKELLNSKKLSCSELTEEYLKAINKENPSLFAYITVAQQEAKATALRVDEKISKGEELKPLEGIPMLLKDNISTLGIRTTCASRMLENYIPIYDAFVWELLKKQNSILLGKGNMDEFAMGSTNQSSYFGAAKNPHNKDYVSGGSSGGVAAAVSGNLAVFGLGSDTGGSIRQPASFCGIVGLKPTYGAVSRYGAFAYASSFDQIGPLASSVEDAALVFDIISKKDKRDMQSRGAKEPTVNNLNNSIKGKKIAYVPQFFEDLSQDVAENVKKAFKVYEKLGAEIVKIDLPFVKVSLPVCYILACAEASSNFARFDGIRYGYRASEFEDMDDMICKTRSEGFGEEVKRRILLGTYVLSAGYFDAFYKKAQILRKTIIHGFAKAFEECDLILAPTAPITALKSGQSFSPVEIYRTDVCTVPVNIAGLPAISVPCGFDRNSMPIGMQLIGNNYSESLILNAAHLFEKETGKEYNKTNEMGCLAL